MSEPRRIGLDNPSFRGRVRSYGHSSVYTRRALILGRSRSMDGLVAKPGVAASAKPKPASKPSVPSNAKHVTKPRPTTNTKPAMPRQTRSSVLARHTVNVKPKNKSKRSRGKVQIFMVAMAMVVFVAGASVALMSYKSNKKAIAQVAVLAKQSDDTSSSDVPDEDAVTSEAFGVYQVAPDLPRYIRIPKLQISARVKRLGVKSSGELGAPKNIFDAGWYDGSSKPGENGAVLIDGHVHGPSKPGVFYRLPNLLVGDIIEVQRGDGKVIKYAVKTTENVPQDKVDMAKALVSSESGRPGLNLITCTGRFDVRTNNYEKRLIVYAVQQ